MRKRLLLPLLASAAVPSFIVAQAPADNNGPAPMNESFKINSVPLIPNLKPSEPGFGAMFFNSRIGSFKIVGPGKDLPRGNVTLECHGSVLISGLDGTVRPTNMKLELNDPTLQKQVYFGKGRIVISGKFKNIQFFGRDLKGAWDGFGIIRFYGEFDKNLETGLVWYAGDKDKFDWGNGGMMKTNPAGKRAPGTGGSGTEPKIRVRDQG